MTKAELLALLATDPDVRAAVREAAAYEGEFVEHRMVITGSGSTADSPPLSTRPGWLTRAPHERAAK